VTTTTLRNCSEKSIFALDFFIRSDMMPHLTLAEPPALNRVLGGGTMVRPILRSAFRSNTHPEHAFNTL
ncbi:MAG: hypothetical protein WA795_11865, partial [Candidatus Sulfotelmatobacter sp.]